MVVQTLPVTRARDQLGLDGGPTVARPIDLGPLVGTWINYDEHSSGISRVEINQRDGKLAVRAFGAGEPEPVDWGLVAGEAFSDGVALREATAFKAHYDFGFMTVMLAAYLNKRLLVLDAYSVFADSDGRSSYFQRDHLYIL
jgi:hypothetical protein